MHRKHPAQALALVNERELIVQHWHERERPPVDAAFLAAIQSEFTERFGDSMSPASIARLLADEGAELRHPEVIECDARWREERLVNQARKFDGITQLASGERLNLDQTETLISKLDTLRQEFERMGDASALSELRGLALEARQRAQALAKKRTMNNADRAEQCEIDEWLKVWLQTPALFNDWLELRRRSEEFRKRFLGGN